MNKMNDLKNDVKSRKLRPVSGVSRFSMINVFDNLSIEAKDQMTNSVQTQILNSIQGLQHLLANVLSKKLDDSIFGRYADYYYQYTFDKLKRNRNKYFTIKRTIPRTSTSSSRQCHKNSTQY